MEQNKRTAIILGATGLTGGKLLETLLQEDAYNKIKLFSRSSVGIKDGKIEEYLGDLHHLEKFQKEFTGDVVFCCVGTTKSKTPNKDFYKKIDLGIPKSAAQLAKENGISTFLVISALGANAKSTIFYNRIKGQMEEAVLQFKIEKTYILQPSLIGGYRKERRLGEWIFKQLIKALHIVMVGPLDKYRSIRPESIAQCMVWLADSDNDYDGIRIESDEIKRLAKK